MKTLLQRATLAAILFATGAAVLSQLPTLEVVKGQEGRPEPPREEGPGQFGPPRGPGRGGFGGPMGPGGMPPSNVMLIAAPEVQTELALTDAQ